jgi:hypothetical protein
VFVNRVVIDLIIYMNGLYEYEFENLRGEENVTKIDLSSKEQHHIDCPTISPARKSLFPSLAKAQLVDRCPN